MSHVHQNAVISQQSIIRRFKRNDTTSRRRVRRKRTNPKMIRFRSTQSDFSSAVMSYFDMTLLRASCWRNVERSVAVAFEWLGLNARVQLALKRQYLEGRLSHRNWFSWVTEESVSLLLLQYRSKCIAFSKASKAARVSRWIFIQPNKCD